MKSVFGNRVDPENAVNLIHVVPEIGGLIAEGWRNHVDLEIVTRKSCLIDGPNPCCRKSLFKVAELAKS